MMKVHTLIYGWDEPITKGQLPDEVRWDLHDRGARQRLIMYFGNGSIGEMRAEADCVEALVVLRKIIYGPGAGRRHSLSESEQRQLHLWHDGDECYLQEGSPPGYIFVNPEPQPEKFH